MFSLKYHFLLIFSDPGTFEFTKPSFIIRESEGVLEVRIVKDMRYVYSLFAGNSKEVQWW